jgi:hypothetical protein
VIENFQTSPGRKDRTLFSEYKLQLQSAVAMLVHDYTMDVFLHDDNYIQQRERRKLPYISSSMHIGMEAKKGIIWDVNYIGLKVSDDLKMNFCVRAKLSYDNLRSKSETVSQIFKCSIWRVVGILRLRLADEDGNLIKNFQFDEEVTSGLFQPVVQEIKRKMRHKKSERVL